MWDLEALRELNKTPRELSRKGCTELARILEECGMTNRDVVKLQPAKGLALGRRFVKGIRKP